MSSKTFSTLCVYFLSDNNFFVRLASSMPREQLSGCFDEMIERFEEIAALLPQEAKEQITNTLLLPYEQFLSDEAIQTICK